MPRAYDGTFTLVAGNPVLPATLIESGWANSTLEDMAQALTDSLSRNGSGGMLVPFEFADGSVASPAITWANQPNSGFYRAGLNDFRMSVGASDVGRWTANTMQVVAAGAFYNVAHSTADFDAQIVLTNSFNYLADVIAAGSELFYGLGGRTNAEADASLALADSALQPLDNISELTNDTGFITAANVPVATGTTFGGFKYTLVGDVLNLITV